MCFCLMLILSEGSFLERWHARVRVTLSSSVCVKYMCDNTTATMKEFTTGSITAAAD